MGCFLRISCRSLQKKFTLNAIIIIDNQYNIWYNENDKTCYIQRKVHLQARLQAKRGRLLRERCVKCNVGIARYRRDRLAWSILTEA